MDLLYGMKILAADYFVLSQCTCLTEKQTDRNTRAISCNKKYRNGQVRAVLGHKSRTIKMNSRYRHKTQQLYVRHGTLQPTTNVRYISVQHYNLKKLFSTLKSFSSCSNISKQSPIKCTAFISSMSKHTSKMMAITNVQQTISKT